MVQTHAKMESSPTPSTLEPEVIALGRKLGGGNRSVAAAKRSVYDRAMAFASADPALRAALFRVVDVAPACRGDRELVEHLAAYLDGVDQSKLAVALGSRAADSRLFGKATGHVAATLVRQMAERFIVGETVPRRCPR